MTARANGNAQTRTIRRWSNTVSGWFIAYFVMILTFLIDPLGSWSHWQEGGQGWNLENVVVVFWFVALSIGSFSFFARPRVEIREDGLSIRGVFKDVHVAWESLSSFDTTSGLYLRVQAGGRWYTAVGVERTNWEVFLGRPIAGVSADQSSYRPVQRKNTECLQTSGASVSWRRPDIQEIVLLVLWAGYLSIGTWASLVN